MEFREFINLFEDELCLFFKKDGVLYGTDETGRITYARMKNPESEEDKAWSKEAAFTAYDLEKSNDKDKVRRPFSKKDTKNIVPVSQEKAEKELEKKGKKMLVVSDDEEQTYGEE